MDSTYSAIQAAMLNDVNRLSIISQNIANATTAGYKKQMHVTTSFQSHLDANSQQQKVINVIPQAEITTDKSSGSVRFTGNPLDVISEENTYFSVVTPTGIAFTKQGSFSINSAGTLVTPQGFPVLGKSGEIRLTTENPVIDKQGNIKEDETIVGTLLVSKLSPDSVLTSIGSNLYTTNLHEFSEEANPNIRQGYTEMANVQIMDEMVRLIETMRHFEAAQKFIQAFDDMSDNSNNIVGQV